MLEEPLSLLIVVSGFYQAQLMLVFPPATDEVMSKMVLFTVILTHTWAIARLTDNLITQYLVPLVQNSDCRYYTRVRIFSSGLWVPSQPWMLQATMLRR